MRSGNVKRMLGGVLLLAGALLVKPATGGNLNPSAPPGSTMHTLEEIYQELTNITALVSGDSSGSPAPVPKTGRTNSYDGAGAPTTGNGDDGDLQPGAAWPTPRFSVGTGTSSNCVTDELTGLMWLKSPDATTRVWTTAELA